MSDNKFTAKDWDEVRSAFAASIMVNTPLSSLAQNLDGPDWPVRGKEETPAAYIDLSYDEMLALLAMKGMTPARADFLITLLKETLAFDNPFGEMVMQAEATALKDNQLLKNLAKLGIPENFPIGLTALSPDTIEFCKLENLATLGEFCIFAQGMSQNVIVGGDFRKLLNALSHVDEASLAESLPFRMGTKGLHLPEAMVQASRAPAPLKRSQQAVDWFKDEFEAIKQGLKTGVSLQRYLQVLGNADAERRAAELLTPLLKASGVSGVKKGGFFGSLGRLFGK
ncbi:MAG: hypothetical protein ABI222_06515 [Opitutaceae bacterium]